jgi:TRAP-type C4-dicarboxylate transport system permease small subunit
MKSFERALRALALASGFILLFVMVYTVADVMMRYVFNRPFSGSVEVTEFSMSLIIFLALPYTAWVGAHISVDLFEKQLDRPWLRFLPAALSFVGAALFALIAWRVLLEALATLNQTSNMLRMPHYPFRFAVAFCSLVFAVVMSIQGWQALRHRPVSNGMHK